MTRRLLLLTLLVLLLLTAGGTRLLVTRANGEDQPASQPVPARCARYVRRPDVWCTNRKLCKLVDGMDALDDNAEGEQEGLADEDEVSCVPLSWRPTHSAVLP